MKKVLLILLTVLMGLGGLTLSAQSTLTVADGTTTNSYVPVYGFYVDDYVRSQTIYPATMLTDMDGWAINSMTFYLSSVPEDAWDCDFTVKLTEVTNTEFSSEAFLSTENATIVYVGELNIASGLMEIEFATPYSYNGGNLLLEVASVNTGTYSSCSFYGVSANNASVQGYSSSSLSSITPSYRNFIPKTTFNYGVPPLCTRPQNVTVVNVTTTEATLSWVGSDNVSSYTLQYMLASQTDWDDDAEEETLTDTAITLTQLTPGATYQVRVNAVCSDNNPTNWTPVLTFNMLNIPVTLPYAQDFETDPDQISDFTFHNGTNGWSIGAATGTPSDDLNDPSTHALYISNDGGVSNAYSISTASYSYAVMDVVFGDDPVEWHLSFDWTAQGESCCDYFSVYLADDAANIPATGDPSGIALLYHVSLSTGWQHEDIILENVSNTSKKIIFYWRNDPSVGTQPPVAVDNIAIVGATCGTPYALATDNITTDSYTFHFSPALPIDDQWEARIMSSTDTVVEVITDTVHTFLNLTPDTYYQISVRTVCGSEEYGQWSVNLSGRTACAPIPAPYTENFAGFNTNPSACWEIFSGLVNSVLAGGSLTPASGGWYYSSSNVFPLGHPKVNIYGTNCNYWLVSPTIDISALSIPVLKFEMALTAYGTEDPIASTTAQVDDKFMVLFSTDFGNTWDTTNIVVWDNTGSQNVYNQIPNIPTEVIIPLSQYMDESGIRIAFYGESTASGGDNDFHIGNVSVIEMPTCFRPTGISIAALSADEATITWNELDQTAWQVAYGPANNFNPEQATPQDANTNSFTMQNLDANTTYSVCIRTVCGANEYSEWTAPISFVTLPGAPAPVPYSYGFEDAEENALWAFANGSQSNAWYIAQPTEETDSVLFISNTGTSESYSNSSSSDVWAYRDFQFGDGAEFAIDIKWKANGESCCDYLKIYIGTPNNVTAGNSTPASGCAQLGSTLNSQSSWQHLIYTLPASYANSTQRLYFLWHNDGSLGDNPAAVIDSIVITASQCGSPYALHTTGITTTTASFAFTPATETDDTWEYAICTGSETPDNTQNTDVITDDEFTVDNLTVATHYTVYVRTVCGNDAYSGWSAALSFVTACDFISVLPWTENFDAYTASSSTRPDCWSFPITYSNGAPYITSGSSSTSPNSLFFQSLTTTPTTAVTPPFDAEINTLRVKFMLRAESLSYSGTFEVGVVSNPNDMTTFESVAVIQPTSTNWTQYIFDLDSVTMTGTGRYIAFRQNSSSSSWYYWLDDVTVLDIPACQEPTGLAVVDATTTSVDLTWNSPDNDFNLYYKTSTDNDWTVEEHIDLTNGVYTLSNLTPSTTYMWKVSNNCSDGSESMSDQSSFSTTMEAVLLPYSTDFEEGSDVAWLFNNGTCVNRWTFGTNNEETAMFVTNDESTAGYSVSSYTVVTAEKLFIIGDAAEYSISFDVKCGGESSWDYMKVFFAPATAEFSASSSSSVPTYATYSYSQNAVDFTNYLSSTGYTSYPYKLNLTNNNVLHIEAIMPNPNTTPDANSTAKLVFLWKNDGSSGTQPAAVIYNVTVSELTCPKPTNLAVSNVTTTSADVAWTPGGTESSWNLEYKESTASTWTTVTTTTPSYQLTGLSSLTAYDVRVQAACGSDDVSMYATTSFSTQSCDASSQCSYTFVLGDGYGDGWNNGSLDVVQNGVVVANIEAVDHDEEETQTYDTITVALCDGISTSLVWHSGSFDDEISITLLDPNGTQLFTIFDLEDITSTTLFTFTTDCSGSGPGPVITNPTVATNAASAIGQTAATLNATITNPDNVTISAKGFEWKTTTGGTYTQIAGTGTGNTFTANLTGLTASTGYTFKAFITYNGTTVYGDEMTFTTETAPVEPCDVPTGLTATDVQSESITVTWDNAAVLRWNLQYGPVGGTLASATATTNSYTFTNLNPLTTYQIQVQAVCEEGNLSEWSNAIQVTTTNLNSYLESNVTLYPNPAKEFVDVRVDGDLNVIGMEVYDVYGKLINTINVIDNTTHINVSGLANGMYFVRVTTEQGMVTKRFVKK